MGAIIRGARVVTQYGEGTIIEPPPSFAEDAMCTVQLEWDHGVRPRCTLPGSLVTSLAIPVVPAAPIDAAVGGDAGGEGGDGGEGGEGGETEGERGSGAKVRISADVDTANREKREQLANSLISTGLLPKHARHVSTSIMHRPNQTDGRPPAAAVGHRHSLSDTFASSSAPRTQGEGIRGEGDHNRRGQRRPRTSKHPLARMLLPEQLHVSIKQTKTEKDASRHEYTVYQIAVSSAFVPAFAFGDRHRPSQPWHHRLVTDANRGKGGGELMLFRTFAWRRFREFHKLRRDILMCLARSINDKTDGLIVKRAILGQRRTDLLSGIMASRVAGRERRLSAVGSDGRQAPTHRASLQTAFQDAGMVVSTQRPHSVAVPPGAGDRGDSRQPGPAPRNAMSANMKRDSVAAAAVSVALAELKQVDAYLIWLQDAKLAMEALEALPFSSRFVAVESVELRLDVDGRR